jgi:DNA polymerase-3 subunit alpha
MTPESSPLSMPPLPEGEGHVEGPFIHLRVHSAYSLAEGALKIPNICSLCKEKTMPAVAMTDTANLFGALEFSLSCASAGIQPIIGCTIELKRPVEEGADSFSKIRGSLQDASPGDPIVLLVKDEKGYGNLLHLISKAYLEEGAASKPQVTYEDLKEFGQGLILLTGGAEGPVGQAVRADRIPLARELLETLFHLFGDRLYMEISRHGLPEEDKTEPFFIQWAQELSIPLVATNTAFFENPSFYEAHDALLCIAAGAYITQEDRRRVTPHHFFKSSEEMKALFADLPEAIVQTQQIARRCSFMPMPRKPIMPSFPTPPGRDENEELHLQAYEGLNQRLAQVALAQGGQLSPENREVYEKRLAYELDIISTMGFSGYFLIVADFIQWARSQTIPVGPGRGSGAGSLVAWSLTITDVDPIQFGLIFERFLNPERVSMPDFDIDFCQNRRDEVITYVQGKYGSDRVAHIITFGKLQAKAVLRDVGRVLQLPYSQVDRISKLVPHNPAQPVTLQEAVDQEPLLQKMIGEDPVIKKLVDMSLQLEGLYRHASTHAAGVVIGDRPLEQLVPLYYDARSPLPATQFSMKYVEEAGLVKFDFLGLKTLTVLQYTVDLLAHRGIHVNLSQMPLDDTKTFEMLGRVETVAVFQLESAGMRDVLRKLQPDRLEEIIALVALYRPGPMDDIPRYLACKHGHEPVTYPHPKVEAILKETFGVMVYQEQVMQIAQVLGGYSLGSADLLRRAMGKKIKKEMDAQRKQFVSGAVDQGVSSHTAHTIFDLMAKFAGYGFNKSHAAPYGLLAYQTAYLKANYPLEFFAATMTLDMGNTDKINGYRQELQRMGISLLPPDINKSEASFSVETQGDGSLAVRYALAAIKNVGQGAMEALVAERQQKGPFKDLIDFAERLPQKAIHKRQLESLIMAGGLDCLCSNRRALFEQIEFILRESHEKLDNSHQGSLFQASPPSSIQLSVDVPDWLPLQRLQNEFDALGFYLSAHPLQTYEDHLKQWGVTSYMDLKEKGVSRSEGGTVKLAGVILAKKERLSKSGNRFAFLQLSDQTGVFEIVVFSEVLGSVKSTYPDLLEVGRVVVCSLSVKQEEEDLRLTALGIMPIEKEGFEKKNSYQVILDQRKAISSLKEVLEGAQGDGSKILIKLILSNKTVVDIALMSYYNVNQSLYSKLTSIKGVREVKRISTS